MPKRIHILVFIVMIFWLPTRLAAQHTSNLRFGNQEITSAIVTLDTVSIIPGTLKLSGLDSSSYVIDYANATLQLKDSTLIGKHISYAYRSIGTNLARPIAHKSPELILPRFVSDPTAQQLAAIAPIAPTTIFDSDLQGNGSISRSVSVGNNQNFVLDANLNLQLSGTLAPGLEILANITDENLPIQPEGNTRYLRDFNKVFIQLKYRDILRLDAGDIELASPQNSYFFQISRQFTGLKAEVHSSADSNNHFCDMVGGGITKGKYVRNEITAIHGVQGPYRLTGEQGETNLIILSGSEQVFLDGVLLTRGQDNDYVIDYNLGEITFTAKHIITEHSRIIVNFEYNDQNYSRYNLFTYNQFTHEKNNKLIIDVNLFHEQDLKRQSIQPELSDEQMLFLAGIGSEIENAFYPTALLVNDFTAQEILYHKTDTVVNGISYSPIYVYAGLSHDSVYRVTFSHVGDNQGNYVLSQSTANGKLYQWVAPIDGVPQGNYEPISKLSTPKMHDLASVGATYCVNDKFKVRTELAFSYADQNLFSKEGDRDNAGVAYKLTADYRTKITNKKLNDTLWRYNVSLDYEFVQKNFSPLSSFRSAEFYRDYNLASDYSSSANEQMLQLATGFSHPVCGSTSYTANWLSRFGELNGFRNQIASVHRFKGWAWNATTSFLLSNDTLQRTRFLKSDNDFSKAFAKVKIGVRDNLEYNIFRVAETNELRANSYAFNEAEIYVKNSDSTKYKYSIAYLNRIDYGMGKDVLQLNSVAHEARASFEFSQWKHNRLKGTASYRNDNLKSETGATTADHNFVGDIDYHGSFWKGAVALNIYYEAGSGLEQKKTYTFLKVATGQGTHIWNDYNGNGIEEVDEFEIAAFQSEAEYVKVWLTTNEYVSTRNCGTTQSLQLRPANIWRSKTGFRKFLSMFSNTTTLRTYQKNTLKHDIRAFNPFRFNFEDSLIVSQTCNFKNALGFALPSPYFSADYTFAINQNKNLLYYGLENAHLSSHQVLLRSAPTNILIIKTLYSRNIKSNRSDGLDNRNYQILSHQLDNSITLTFKNGLSFSTIYKMGYKKNLWDTEKANIYQIVVNGEYRMKERGTLSLNLEYAKILFNQTENNSISYEMLEGLTAGNNFLWQLTYQTRLFEYLQLALSYEGRLTNDNRLIHTGFLQIKALF